MLVGRCGSQSRDRRLVSPKGTELRTDSIQKSEREKSCQVFTDSTDSISMKSGKLVGDVTDMSYHRNGSGGRGFWSILFEGHPGAEDLVANHTFIATFFPADEVDEDGDYEGTEACVAVLRVNDISKGNLHFGWRGDNFQDELQALVDSYVWPFDRDESHQLDGAGREITHRREAILAQKARNS